MRADAKYLVSISHRSKEFDAVRFVDECINHELEQLRHASIFSSLHEHVLRNGYPVPKEQISLTSYVNRAGLETALHDSLLASRNLYLIGCEGSGKTTLLHYVISSNYHEYQSFFAYVDVSDIGIETSAFSDTFFDKIRNALFLGFSENLKSEFKTWLRDFETDPFARDLVNTSTTKRFVEAILIFLNSRPSPGSVYLIVDNIDSLRSKIVEDFFASLQMLEGAVVSAFHTLNISNHDRVRFIACCRTQSIDVVQSASHGLFTRSAFSTINMDARFLADTNILDLTRKFLEKERSYIFRKSLGRRTQIHVPANFGGTVGWESFEDYSEDVFDWLDYSRDEVNSIVAKFCGRSIRRSKLFIVKALASPVIARLVFFEKHKIFNITRTEPEYLNRRLREALFDFSTSAALHMPGYPLNPFGVLRDDRNFRNNPLIGVAMLLYIDENLKSLRLEDVQYAQAIGVRPIVEYLQAMRYGNEAIIECFRSVVLSGLLRAIKGSNVALEEESVESKVFEGYILDDYAFHSYIDLILFKRWTHSLTFYNMALRARYGIRSDHHLDNFAYEAYTFLVFLFDLLEREQKLEQQIEGTGVMFRPLSARIRHIVFTILPNEVDKKSQAKEGQGKAENIRKEQTELVQRTREMLEEARWKLSKQAGIL
jgi:GTPase SAR1 family protein